MTVHGIFLDYHGHIDFHLIDSLLMKLKKTKEFEELNTTTRKRAYSLIVESIENIYKHSALMSSVDEEVLPHFSVTNEEKKIIISAGNPIPVEKRARLAERLDLINKMDVAELKRMHEKRINCKPAEGDNGAGLGFICMAFKSGNKLNYSFNPLVSGYLYFEIQISLNK
jgi:hypothetical protein